ncbi:alkylation response protein AidB-like acyl-CoA dehydrogenase [Thermocatellispora tengchongensis]|uniref:Alkylation response protein AidB-like acyl-CoA dehydrogenase n=1 Tax=Thermocatellispora tengchongensis TaxID=1073253 RepID=A0A840PCX8_9ACTN|nr:acyl-CoA dehydrogenase family protein [Thermocatellispora tengchongensis]MBB5135701.1 alkylation response protein AidB-like acyl-CoA dehydrogenase [Thermocatellispora tengchongensis]
MTTTNELPGETTLRAPESRDAVLANAEAVLDLVAEEAADGDAKGRITERAARALRRAGLFEMGFPARLGGLEMTLADQVAVVAKIARVDAGTAWNVGVLNATGFYAGRLGDEAYHELYPTRDMPTSGSFHPKGRAQVTDGGYLVTGRWDWGSGSYVAEHIIGGCLVFDGDEPVPAPGGGQLTLGLWLPREAVEHAHNWHTLGVRGSGSSSYSITEPVFIPAKYSFDREAPANPDADPLNKHVTLAFFGLTGVCVGVAQHALDLALAAVRRRVGPSGSADATVRRALGQACAEVDMLLAGVTDIAKRTDEIIFTPGRVLTPTQEHRLIATNTMAAETLRRVLDLCVELYGSRYLFDDDPMQRVLRDAWGALAHAGAKRMHWGSLAEKVLRDPAGEPTLFGATPRAAL